MKNLFLKAIVPFMSLATMLVASDGSELIKPACPQYDHRMNVFHPLHIGYEYLPNDDIYFGVEAIAAGAYNQGHSWKTKGAHMPAFLEARIGRSYFYGGQDHVRPFVGGMVGKDLKTIEYSVDSIEFQQRVKLEKVTSPVLAFGFIGCSFEREFNSRVALGLTAKALIGGPIHTVYPNQRYAFNIKDLYYGVDLSLPFTIRLGSARNWDIRLEPFAVVMNGSVRYLGHRSAVAYRF